MTQINVEKMSKKLGIPIEKIMEALVVPNEKINALKKALEKAETFEEIEKVYKRTTGDSEIEKETLRKLSKLFEE